MFEEDLLSLFDDFGEYFVVQGTGNRVKAIFNEPSAAEQIEGFAIDLSHPYLEAGVQVALQLTEGETLVRVESGNRRYRVVGKPFSQNNGCYLISLVRI